MRKPPQIVLLGVESQKVKDKKGECCCVLSWLQIKMQTSILVYLSQRNGRQVDRDLPFE